MPKREDERWFNQQDDCIRYCVICKSFVSATCFSLYHYHQKTIFIGEKIKAQCYAKSKEK